jgi:hypothetical protein
MPATTREKVLRLFEKHRASPGMPFDEAHFLNFLLAHPKAKHSVYDSFSSLRRYNAFIDDIQLDFSICFSIHDFYANYSLDAFIRRIEQLQVSRRSSLASLRNQKRHGFGWGTVFITNIFAVCLIVSFVRHSIHLACFISVAGIMADILIIHFYLRWRLYRKSLLNKLLGNSSNDI